MATVQASSVKSSLLTSLCVVAVGGVVARAEALPVMHHHSGEVVEEVLGARRARGAGAAGAAGAGGAFGRGLAAAVRLHVEELVEADVDADLLPVVAPRPPEDQDGDTVSESNLSLKVKTSKFGGFSVFYLQSFICSSSIKVTAGR